MTRHIRVRTYILEQLKGGEKTTDQLFNELKEKHPRQMSTRRALVTIIRNLPDVTHPNLDDTNIWKLRGD